MALIPALQGSEDAHDWITVVGLPTEVAGLWVTRSSDFNGPPGWWSITHLPSGRSVGPYVYPSEKAAERTAAALGRLMHWSTFEGGPNSITGPLLDQVKSVCKVEGKHIADVVLGEGA